MSFTEVFVSRLPKRKILTIEPDWVGGIDQLDFDLELHKEIGPAYLLQLTDKVVNWQNNFIWQGAFDGTYGDVADEVLKACWRNKHGASFPFFMPTWKNDLTLATDIALNDTTITVRSIDQAFMDLYNIMADRPGRNWYQPEFGDYRLRFSLLGLLLIHSDGTEEEVRRFIPIGDKAIADDELSTPQGAGAVTPSGNDLNIKLRLMAGEELPAIAMDEVRLLSLMYHVRFAGKVQASFSADYVPRISATMFQVFDESIFAPDIEASFDLYNPDNSEGSTVYRQGRRTAGQPDLTITVSLTDPAPVNGFEVAYDLEGNAVAGTHYNITAGASPLVFAKGETQKTITLQTPATPDWFLERDIIFKLNKPLSSALVAFTEVGDEFRVYIQPDMLVNPPPNVDWTTDASTFVGDADDVHSGAVATVTDAGETQEDTQVHYEVDDASTAVEGVDYEVLLQSGERTISSSSGESNATMPFRMLKASGTGETLILNLLYERSTGEDRNEATFSEAWIPQDAGDGPDGDNPVPNPSKIHINFWPTNGNTGIMSIGPSFTIVVGRPWSVKHFRDTEKAHPDNPLRRLDGYLTRPNAVATGYIRGGAADEFDCDGQPELFPLQPWQRFSIFIDAPSPSSEASEGLPRFIRVVLRDRGFVGEGGSDVSHVVVFDTDSGNGGLITRVDTSLGRFGVLKAIHTAGGNASDGDWEISTSYVAGGFPNASIVTQTGVAPPAGDSMYRCILAHTSSASDEPGVGGSWTTFWEYLGTLHYGVNQIGVPPNDRTQLWLAYNELDPDRISGDNHPGPSRSNRLIFVNNYSEAGESNQENINRGLLMYDPQHYIGTADPLALPIVYWPRPRSRWEPRGNGFIGTLVQHTITM